MNITTKFNVGDKVWFIHDSAAEEDAITGVHFQAGYGELRSCSCTNFGEGQTSYIIGEFPNALEVEEGRVFSTKEELIASL